jgi:dTDP-4-amino-4,6-dideoxygalactose transaminase
MQMADSGTATRIGIPFNRPTPVGKELRLVAEAIENGELAGDGEMSRACERILQDELEAPAVLLTPSCTQALEMSALLLDIAPGDEIITPSFTYPSTAGAFVLRGARPVFGEIRPDTLNLAESQVEQLIGSRTRAVVCTHYAGVGCEMDGLLAVCERHGIALIEDAALALFGTYRDRPLGTLGRFGAISFHETKNVTSGEGGALILNDPRDVERAEILREKGTDRAAFRRGHVSAYGWVDVGSSYLPSELQAAFLLGQLEQRREIQAVRHRIWNRYALELQDWGGDHDVALPIVPADCRHPAHLFHLMLPTRAARDGLIAHLRQRGIVAAFHYQPLHLSRMGRRLAPNGPPLPVTEAASERIVRLPLYHGLSDGQQSQVIEAVTDFRP